MVVFGVYWFVIVINSVVYSSFKVVVLCVLWLIAFLCVVWCCLRVGWCAVFICWLLLSVLLFVVCVALMAVCLCLFGIVALFLVVCLL